MAKNPKEWHCYRIINKWKKLFLYFGSVFSFFVYVYLNWWRYRFFFLLFNREINIKNLLKTFAFSWWRILLFVCVLVQKYTLDPYKSVGKISLASLTRVKVTPTTCLVFNVSYCVQNIFEKKKQHTFCIYLIKIFDMQQLSHSKVCLWFIPLNRCLTQMC